MRYLILASNFHGGIFGFLGWIYMAPICFAAVIIGIKVGRHFASGFSDISAFFVFLITLAVVAGAIISLGLWWFSDILF